MYWGMLPRPICLYAPPHSCSQTGQQFELTYCPFFFFCCRCCCCCFKANSAENLFRKLQAQRIRIALTTANRNEPAPRGMTGWVACPTAAQSAGVFRLGLWIILSKHHKLHVVPAIWRLFSLKNYTAKCIGSRQWPKVVCQQQKLWKTNDD